MIVRVKRVDGTCVVDEVAQTAVVGGGGDEPRDEPEHRPDARAADHGVAGQAAPEDAERDRDHGGSDHYAHEQVHPTQADLETTPADCSSHQSFTAPLTANVKGFFRFAFRWRAKRSASQIPRVCHSEQT